MGRAGKPVIGVAGGIGSGKSTVAAVFAEFGAAVIDSDRIGHEELNDPQVLATLHEWWGDRVIAADGRADRAAIRRIVGADEAARRRLEAILHPRIAERSEALLAEYLQDGKVRAIVWDAPLLYEAGLARRCDCVVFVEASPDVRLSRVRDSRGWTSGDLQVLEKSQKSLDYKRDNADYIIENNSDMDALRGQVRRVLSKMFPEPHDHQSG